MLTMCLNISQLVLWRFNMLLTNVNILNQIGEYSTRGWDLHLMPQLPKSLEQFKNSYIVINTNNIPKLHYIKFDGKVEDVNIVDSQLFQQNKNLILFEKDKTFFKPSMVAKLHLTEDEVKNLITSNGGHCPTNKVASSLFQNPEKFKALYEGCDQYDKAHDKKIKQFEKKFGELDSLRELDKKDKCYFRKALMEYTTKRIQDKGDVLKYKVQNPDIRETDPKLAAILLKDMLGKEGVALYHAALQEEANDREFRKAVFCNSATHFKGEEWKERPVVIVSGPSACGKSFAAKATVDESLEFLATKQSSHPSPGNYVIAADGGVVREVSQIRKWVIKESTKLGYPGVKDLQEHSQILESIKKHVRQQAFDLPNLGVVIPETFSKWFVPGNNAKKMLKTIEGLPNTRVIFARVEGQDPSIFKKVVAFMGSTRAWKDFTNVSKEKDELSRQDLNSTEGVPESKSYGPKGFKFGVNGSIAAEKWFIKHSKENLRMIITNELILVKPKDINNPNAGWMEAELNDKGAIKLSRRAYEAWEQCMETNKGSPDEYCKKNKITFGSLIKTSLEIDLEICISQIEALKSSKNINPINESALNSLGELLKEIQPITRNCVEKLGYNKELIEALRHDISQERKWLFFETGTQKVFNQSLQIFEEAIKAKSCQLDEQEKNAQVEEISVTSFLDEEVYKDVTIEGCDLPKQNLYIQEQKTNLTNKYRSTLSQIKREQVETSYVSAPTMGSVS